jgi:hypothetical protein
VTSDAIRQPGDSTRPPAEPTAPSASEVIPPETEDPGTTPPDENATPAAGEVTAEAAAREPSADADTAQAVDTQTTQGADGQAAETPAADAQAAAAEAIDSSEAVSPAETVTTAEAVAATEAAAADAPAVPGPRRRERVGTFLKRLVVVVLAVALLVGGIMLGSAIFQRTRAAGDVIPPGQVGTTAEQPALVTQEFIGALRANDFDSMRSSMQPEAAIHFADEIERRGVMKIDKVEVLGTHVAGQRSATEILMQYQSDQEIPLSINLVILVDGGKIEGFR